MPKLERLKEELAIQKQLFFAAVAVVLGLTGWVVTNLEKHWLLIAAGSIVVVLSGLFAATRFRRMGQLLEEIEDA